MMTPATNWESVNRKAMRNGQHQHQHKRMRGRNQHQQQQHHRKNQNPLTRVYESNGPDVKIRGTASHVTEKYLQLARDASTSGDHVTAENYYQHAEHYLRLIAAAQEQFRQQNPYYRPEGEMRDDTRDDTFDDADEGMGQPMQGQPMQGQPMQGQPNFGNQQPQPPRDAQPYPGREPQPSSSGREQQNQGRPQQQQQQQYQQNQQQSGNTEGNDGEQLPSFITGGGGQSQQNYSQNGDGNQGGDRFRRRRRHRGPQGNLPSGSQDISGNEAPDDPRSGNE
jgi:hypothetical protein